MEFKLNKIDTDIRSKMQEENRADKINKNNNVNIKKDITKEKSKNSDNKKKTKDGKKFFQVDCVKYVDKELGIQVEKIQITDEENQKGQCVDTKK